MVSFINSRQTFPGLPAGDRTLYNAPSKGLFSVKDHAFKDAEQTEGCFAAPGRAPSLRAIFVPSQEEGLRD